MSARLDAHSHFFYPGFVGRLPASCRRERPDEITLYSVYAQEYNIAEVLAIGYEGEQWAAGNNNYLAQLQLQHSWVRPIAFVADPSTLTIQQLNEWQAQGFVGISIYIFSPDSAALLQQTPDDCWKWLVDQAWLLSINSSGEQWSAWHPILARHPALRLLIAHLGLPPAAAPNLSLEEARAPLGFVRELAAYPHTYVKYSGFYALAHPTYEYPHAPAWPYAEVIKESFGASRILWASDFSPALEHVSFGQTVAVLDHLSFLSSDERTAIMHDNLATLLAEIAERKPTR
jgi:predicted TIM-barrel fold metal-dependent hydrolase